MCECNEKVSENGKRLFRKKTYEKSKKKNPNTR
jgi:hypothetical protein